MANLITKQLLEDGERNVVVNVVGYLDTADAAGEVILDVSALSAGNPVTNRLLIMHVEYSIEATLTCILQFDATTPVDAVDLYGFGKLNYEKVGGIPNNAGVGVTGDILLSTEGWSGGAKLHFTIKLKCKKYTV